jgi:hypothetical protein
LFDGVEKKRVLEKGPAVVEFWMEVCLILQPSFVDFPNGGTFVIQSCLLLRPMQANSISLCLSPSVSAGPPNQNADSTVWTLQNKRTPISNSNYTMAWLFLRASTPSTAFVNATNSRNTKVAETTLLQSMDFDFSQSFQ